MQKKILAAAFLPVFILSGVIMAQASTGKISWTNGDSNGTRTQEKTYGTSTDKNSKSFGTSTDEKIYGTTTEKNDKSFGTSTSTSTPDFKNFGTFKRNFSVNLNFKATSTEMNATGTARMTANLGRDGLYAVTIRESLRNLSTSTGNIFESWLFDEQTGYYLSLGALKPGANGRATFNFSQKMINFPIYDRLIVTKETLNDTDPQPGLSVLEADIPDTFSTFHLRANLNSNNCPAASTGTTTATSTTGTGRFIINTQNKTIGYDLKLNNLQATGTTIAIHGPAQAGGEADVLLTIPAPTSTDGNITGVIGYDQSWEGHLLGGKTYMSISTGSSDCTMRGQITP